MLTLQNKFCEHFIVNWITQDAARKEIYPSSRKWANKTWQFLQKHFKLLAVSHISAYSVHFTTKYAFICYNDVYTKVCNKSCVYPWTVMHEKGGNLTEEAPITSKKFWENYIQWYTVIQQCFHMFPTYSDNQEAGCCNRTNKDMCMGTLLFISEKCYFYKHVLSASADSTLRLHIIDNE